jgi:hypothetical protein
MRIRHDPKHDDAPEAGMEDGDAQGSSIRAMTILANPNAATTDVKTGELNRQDAKFAKRTQRGKRRKIKI